MSWLRYSDIQNSRIPAKLGVCATSTELLKWTNSFEQRAAAYGRWWGSTQLTQFCVRGDGCGGACIVSPPQIAVVEAANLNSQPIDVQGSSWGQFNRPHLWWGQSYGFCSNGSAPCTDVQNFRCGCGCGCLGAFTLQDEGLVASYNTTASGDKIRLYITGTTADVGKKVVIQGNDSNGNWVRTQFSDGTVQDGEELVLANPYVESVTTWATGAPLRAFKEATIYRVLGYAYDGTSERQILDYGPQELNPTYRKMRLPGVRGCGCDGRSTLRALVSLQPGVITGSNDWLLFADATPAYSDGIMAEKLYENLETAAADSYFFGNPRPARNGRGVLLHSVGMGALGFLESQLRKQTGDKTTVRVQRDGLLMQGFV